MTIDDLTIAERVLSARLSVCTPGPGCPSVGVGVDQRKQAALKMFRAKHLPLLTAKEPEPPGWALWPQ